MQSISTSSNFFWSEYTLDLEPLMAWNLCSIWIRGALFNPLLIRLSDSWQLLFQRFSRSRTELRMWLREPLCMDSSNRRHSAICWSWTGILLGLPDWFGVLLTYHQLSNFHSIFFFFYTWTHWTLFILSFLHQISFIIPLKYMYLYKYSLCIQFTDNLHLIHFNTCIKIPMFFTLYSVEKKDDIKYFENHINILHWCSVLTLWPPLAGNRTLYPQPLARHWTLDSLQRV